MTSGAYGEDEILELLEALRPEEDPEELLERLLAVGFVFERGLAGDQFRTRMAETVRLARHLRQWFHEPRSDWRTAKPLVSDLRFLARSRVVPVRGVDELELTRRLSASLDDQWTTSHETTVGAILGGRKVSEIGRETPDFGWESRRYVCYRRHWSRQDAGVLPPRPDSCAERARTSWDSANRGDLPANRTTPRPAWRSPRHGCGPGGSRCWTPARGRVVWCDAA